MDRLNLRDYQESYISELRNSFKKGNKKIVLCAPTGAGKTIMFSYMTKNSYTKGNKVLILTDRKELFSQSDSVLTKLGMTPQLIKPNEKVDLNENLFVGMIQTIMRRIDSLKQWINTLDLIIIDEAHKSIFDNLFDYINENTFVIGATATPFREGKQRALSDFYTDIIQVIDTPELINKGNLSKPISYGVKIDLKGVKTKGGDYDEKSLADKYSEIKLFHGVYDNYTRICNGKKAIVFCPNIDSSIELVKSFQEKGLPAKHVDCYMNNRDEIIEWFENTEGAILSNYGILTTGFDCPTIEVVILYRATKSLPLFLQMVGRGSRVTSSKNLFTILDFGNNIRHHNYWEDPRSWSLDKKEKKEGAAPIKECTCGYLLYASIMECPECGNIFEKTEDEKVKDIIVELQELSKTKLKNRIEKADFKELELIALAKGYSKNWIFHQLKSAEDFRAFGKYKGFKPAWAEMQIQKRIV
jgi:superfamily II DNA or RNA helicase